MNSDGSWEWVSEHVPFDPDREGSQVWINPRPPGRDPRARCPLRVEIMCYCVTLVEIERARGFVQESFDGDSVLAAIEREDTLWRFVVYTETDEVGAYRRYSDLRETWKPAMLGIRLVRGRTWEDLVAPAPGPLE